LVFIKPSVLKLERDAYSFLVVTNGKSVFFEILNPFRCTENINDYSLQRVVNVWVISLAKIGNKLVNYASEINVGLETDISNNMASGETNWYTLPMEPLF
jgi:putative DNA primase/helicase